MSFRKEPRKKFSLPFIIWKMKDFLINHVKIYVIYEKVFNINRNLKMHKNSSYIISKLAPVSLDLSQILQEYFYVYPQISILVKTFSHKAHEF